MLFTMENWKTKSNLESTTSIKKKCFIIVNRKIFLRLDFRTWDLAAGRRRLPLGVPESGVPPPEGGSCPLMASASKDEHPGAQMDAERALLQPFNEASSFIVISRVTKSFYSLLGDPQTFSSGLPPPFFSPSSSPSSCLRSSRSVRFRFFFFFQAFTRFNKWVLSFCPQIENLHLLFQTREDILFQIKKIKSFFLYFLAFWTFCKKFYLKGILVFIWFHLYKIY